MSKPELTKQREKREWGEMLAPVKTKWNEAVLFAKRLFFVLFGLIILGLGVYAVVKGQDATALKQLAFTVSGVCAVVDGFYVLYCGLVRVK